MTDRIEALEEITDPDFIWGALDNVHDAETTLADYAAAVSRAQRAALAASQSAPDCHQPGLATADSSQPAQPVAVKVKPLVWEAGERDQRRAYSVVGEFCVTFFGGRWFYEGEPRNGMLDAQAAAQADYEARIMAALDVQPLTVQAAARVPEIAALIEKSEALRDDVTGRVDAFGDRIGIAQPMIGFGAKQWADFVAALRAIAEGE